MTTEKKEFCFPKFFKHFKKFIKDILKLTVIIEIGIFFGFGWFIVFSYLTNDVKSNFAWFAISAVYGLFTIGVLRSSIKTFIKNYWLTEKECYEDK